jgi:hypothetical protein
MPLSLTWTGVGGGQRQARSAQLRAGHGLWHVTQPRADGRVELCYGRFDAEGRLPGLPLPIGLFDALAEAMLAVEMHEAAMANPNPLPPVASPWRLLGPDGDFVLEPEPGGLALRLEQVEPRLVARLMQAQTTKASRFTAAERPLGIADPAALDASILRRIAMLRRRRADVPAEQPLTVADVADWRRLRDPLAPG